MNWIQTLDGKAFNLDAPDPNTIDPDVLATVLSRICRFSGHCREFYSVAQHSVKVCDIVSLSTDCPDIRLAALLHDAHEGYWGFCDPARPAKQAHPSVEIFLKSLAGRMDIAIAERFGIDVGLFKHRLVKHADDVALATEARQLMTEPPLPWAELPEPHPVVITPWRMDVAATHFRSRLNYLLKENSE